MPNERQRRLMQEALDASLSPEVQKELLAELDPAETAEFDRLKLVDRTLRTAPFEHAPERMALNIMARLAEGLRAQRLPETTGMALALGLALVTVVMVPVLAAAGWLFLNAIGNAAALNLLLERVVGLVTVVISGLELLVKSAQDFLQAYPETPALVVTLIPVSLFWLIRATMQKRDGE